MKGDDKYPDGTIFLYAEITGEDQSRKNTAAGDFANTINAALDPKKHEKFVVAEQIGDKRAILSIYPDNFTKILKIMEESNTISLTPTPFK